MKRLFREITNYCNYFSLTPEHGVIRKTTLFIVLTLALVLPLSAATAEYFKPLPVLIDFLEEQPLYANSKVLPPYSVFYYPHYLKMKIKKLVVKQSGKDSLHAHFKRGFVTKLEIGSLTYFYKYSNHAKNVSINVVNNSDKSQNWNDLYYFNSRGKLDSFKRKDQRRELKFTCKYDADSRIVKTLFFVNNEYQSVIENYQYEKLNGLPTDIFQLANSFIDPIGKLYTPTLTDFFSFDKTDSVILQKNIVDNDSVYYAFVGDKQRSYNVKRYYTSNSGNVSFQLCFFNSKTKEKAEVDYKYNSVGHLNSAFHASFSIYVSRYEVPQMYRDVILISGSDQAQRTSQRQVRASFFSSGLLKTLCENERCLNFLYEY